MMQDIRYMICDMWHNICDNIRMYVEKPTEKPHGFASQRPGPGDDWALLPAAPSAELSHEKPGGS